MGARSLRALHMHSRPYSHGATVTASVMHTPVAPFVHAHAWVKAPALPSGLPIQKGGGMLPYRAFLVIGS